MRYDVGRFRRPMRRSTEGQLMSLISLGDGSTLTLDFTTGVLDPRLTFDRTSTATFINSSGLVQFANANLMTFSTPRASGSAWLTTGTVTWGSATIADPNGAATAQEVTFGTAGSAFFNSAGTTVTSGITHTFSVWLRAATGTTNVRLGSANAAVSTVTLTTTWQRFSIQYTTVNATDGGAVFSQTGTPSATFYVWGAQLQPGSTVGELLETTGSLRRNTPRFDHDPTTLAPRGLLIEGTATNLVTQSNGSTSVWGTGGNRTPTNNTTDLVSPDGTNNATKLVCGSAGAYASFATSISGLTGGATYTISYWIRGPVGHSPRLFAQNGTTGDVTATATTGTYNNTGWTRLTQTYTLPAATTQCLVYFLSANIGTTGDTFYVYGFQMETGAGASSHIPTGASQVQRLQDLLSITSTNFSSWWTSNNPASFLVDISSTNRPLANHIFRIADSSGFAYGYQSYFNSTTMPMQVRAAMSSTASSDVAIGTNLAANTRTKIGFTIESAALKRFRDGSLAHTLNTPTLPPNTMTQMYIGGTTSFGNASADFHIRQFKYWPITLSDAAMQGFTT